MIADSIRRVEAGAVPSGLVQPDRILELGDAFKRAKVLLSAVELGIFTILADGPLDCATLGHKAGMSERGTRDFLDALVALGMLARDAKNRYANTPETDLYLDQHKPTYIGGFLEFTNARVFAPWASLTDALRTGMPQSGARAIANYGAYYADAAVRGNFAKGMTGGSLPAAKAIAERFPWCDYQTVIDIGTAEGCLPVQVALAHSHLSGGGFDLPQLAPLFQDYVREHGLSKRLRFHPGDFFADPLPCADVIVMGRVLHNWDLPSKKMLLRKAYEALSPGGALIVYERLIDDERRSNIGGLLASLNMLVMTAGGFDFTGADCIGWMREAGFRELRVEPLAAELSMAVGTK
jgi:hypothetical protein